MNRLVHNLHPSLRPWRIANRTRSSVLNTPATQPDRAQGPRCPLAQQQKVKGSMQSTKNDPVDHSMTSGGVEPPTLCVSLACYAYALTN